MKPLRSVLYLPLALALFFGGTARGATLFDQNALLFNTNYQRGVNWQAQGGVPISHTAGNPPGSNGNAPSDPAPTFRQFQGGIVYGAVTFQRKANLNPAISFAANARNLEWPHTENADSSVALVIRGQAGAPYMMKVISFLFGSPIPVPRSREDGTLLTETEAKNYWAAEPVTANAHADTGYYWSPHASAVYAIQPGRVDITWRRATPEPSAPADPDKYALIGGNYFLKFATNYTVSGATFKKPRRMFWTEKTFQNSGKPIVVPAARVGLVNIVYQKEFPERVAEEISVAGQSEVVEAATNRLQELRTLWHDRTDGQIHAYNKEGRVFVELLGDVRSGAVREPLGYEIVDVIRQAAPEDVTVELGEKLIPPATTAGLGSLSPEPILSDITKNFAYRQGEPGSSRITLYATRETKNLNDYQVYWMEEGIASLRWPAALARYRMIWPAEAGKYSHYLREASDKATAKLTAVPMPTANVPIIEWQDRDLADNPRAFLTEDFKFYTHLDANFPAHRTLLRFTAGENVAFERVFSWLDTSVKSGADLANSAAADLNIWDDVSGRLVIAPEQSLQAPRVVDVNVWVGQRLAAPAQELNSGTDGLYLAGSIRMSAGTGFSASAYLDPFAVGFEEAARGSIIPVNAGRNNGRMEVWWYRKNAQDSAKGFKPVYWPSVIGRYRLRWPTEAPHAREIILASNDGSGALSSLEAAGSIYFQNDRTQPGYNPNEEHALMLGGQAYALRDDLNVLSGGNYSSHPYVLLEYRDSDGRPSMTVFQVLREKGDIRFDYAVAAGTVLQPPMPLPFLEKPLGPRVIGTPARSLNKEAGFWPTVDSRATEAGGVSLVEVTTQDRHFFKPYQSLALQNVPSSGAVTTRWFYTTNVDARAQTIGGFAATNAPYAVSNRPESEQPAVTTRIKYKVSTLSGLTTGDTVVVVKESSSENWVVTVTGAASTADGATVEVEFASNSRAAAMEATRLVKPMTNVANDAFAGGDWRLAYQVVSPSLEESARREFFAGFTLQDRKGDLWVYRGPHSSGDAVENSQMVMQFYYKTLPGFHFPAVAQQPPVGTITPYLRPANPDGSFAGDAIRGDADNNGIGDENSLGVIYRPAWPAGVPVLQMAESLTLPKRGLPAIRGQRSLEIVYQQSQLQPGSGLSDRSAVLHDPTREKVFFFGPEESTTALSRIPDSVKTSNFRGKTYFPNLPPHLSERFFFDPNRGSNGALVLLGEFRDEALGDDYLLLNVVGDKDIIDLTALCLADDLKKGLWDGAITNGLQTVMELFVENPARPGTFVPSSPEAIAPGDLSEVKDDDVAVDSYALTAMGPGTGYVTLIAGNGFNIDVTPAEEPVSVQIVRVVDRLYRGELKIVESSNPLAEKITLQQVVDLAGKVDAYEFEWKITSPVDGQPPAVYQNTRRLLLGDDAWHHIPFPLAGETPGGVGVGATPANRRSTDVNGTVVARSRVAFQNVSTNDGRLYFQGAGASTAVAANKVVVRYEDGSEVNGTVVPRPASQPDSLVVVQVDAGQTLPTSNSRIIDLYEHASAAGPQSIVFREFSIPNDATYSQFYLSLNLDAALGAKVYVNGSLAVTAHLETGNSSTVSAPAGFLALPMVYRLGPEVFAGGNSSGSATVHQLTVELFSTALPNVNQTFNLRLEAYEVLDLASGANSPWLPLSASLYQDKVRAILGENADVRALSDNYLISRYRAIDPSHASYRPDQGGLKQGWSQWTDPQLAEGWIKRVLGGINPFNQRVNDLFNNRVNTDVSIITQAGARWEGDVALNLDTINDAGLIEIYETVLNRGKKLSIESGINFGPANDALLLAAGYLNDLYMMLGNEAWADAANPTIGIGTQNQTYGEVATALFAFKGQMSSLLEEELALLRGRDDFLVPGVTTRPVYNRLFWNYTRGIDSGEVIYALNYNIQENNDSGVDGIINADDARKMFPQGHGDAYGHYLTALKGYYSLLMDVDFDWVPRIEAVTVLGKPVSVDYQDERKFAAAAAAVARAGRQVFDLTWRKDFIPGQRSGWKHFATNRVNTTRLQPVPRKWGADHWASRTAQGAYLNWAIGNAILPDVDPDPTHEGIQKVDRSTVPELKELATMAEDLQSALNNAEGHLTPLGLADGSLAFDIDPLRVTGPDSQTHFEQIYGRAKKALGNALAAFDDAKDVTRMLRSEQDSLAELQTKIGLQELAYTNELVELYGTPYTDDIGPGRTYTQGYSGPDLIHYMYVETPELNFPGILNPAEKATYKIDVQSLPEARLLGSETMFNDLLDSSDPNYTEGEHFIEFELSPHGFFGKPQNWMGRRVSPGRIQQAISDIIKARNAARQALDDLEGQKEELDGAVRLFKAEVRTVDSIHALERDKYIAEFVTQGVEVANEIFQDAQDTAEDAILKSVDVIKESLPQSLIAGLAAGGDLTAPARGAAEAAGAISAETLEVIAKIASATTKLLRLANDQAASVVDLFEIAPLENAQGFRQQVYDLTLQLNTMQDAFATLNARLQEYDDAMRRLRGLEAQGNRIQIEREIFRQRSAALVQGFRTRDAAFRIFRTEKLERYKTLFDLAARYSFLAANAYDYETGLLHTQQGREFINRIVSSRALGVMRNGEPQFAGSNSGDPGLSSVLAEMMTDFEVLKGRLGFNNPSAYGTTVSLRTENERIIPAADGHATWQDVLQHARRANLLDDEDVRRYCMQIERGNGLPVPGIVIEFSTTQADGVNLFGKTLAGGDHYFDNSFFATKIFGVGVALEGYIGMNNPVANSSAVNGAGGYSPPDPETTFLGSLSLAATPGIYLIPVGVDSMRSPPLGDGNEIRTWSVNDVAIPLPFNIGGSDFSTKALWQSSESLTEPLFAIRKHHAFRPVSTTAAFSSSIYGGAGNLQLSQFTNNRLIGRSVWNTKWKLVIPGHRLLADPMEGLDRFTQTVRDIKLHFVTYSYAGN